MSDVNFYSAKSNFTGGQWSPQMRGRHDLPQYENAVEVMKNFTPFPQGGVGIRAGTLAVAPAKFHTGNTVGMEFEFDSDQTYFIEWGDLYARFYTQNARIEDPALTITNVTNSSGLIRITSAGHGLSDGNPVCIRGVLGTYEANGDWIVTGAATNTFDLTGSTHAHAYTSGGTARKIYELVSPYSEADLYEVKTAAESDVMYLFHKSYPTYKLTRTSASTFTLAAVDWTCVPFLNTNVSATTLQAQGNTLGATIVLNSTPGIFNSNSVGVYYAINSGVVKVTGFTNSTHVNAVVKYMVTNGTMNNAATTNWAEGSWTPWSGYPVDGDFYENKLVVGGSLARPLQINGSRTAPEYENFNLGTGTGSDGYQYDLRSRQSSAIRWIAGDDLLFVGTSGREFKVTGTDNGAITATSILARPQASHGSMDTEPVITSSGVAFAQRTKTKLRVLRFDLEADRYKAPDTTLMANDILDAGIKQLTYEAEPYDIIYATLNSGAWATLTLLAEQNVQAWSSHDTDGHVLSLKRIRTVGNDQTWLIVRRSIQGNYRTFIEFFDPSIAVDSAVRTTFDSPVSTITSGLHHLEGREVCIIGDGAVYPNQVVTGGALPSTLSSPAFSIVVGLPFDNELKLLPPSKELPDGHIAGRRFKISKVKLLVNETMGLTVNGDKNYTRIPEDLMDMAPPTGFGWVEFTPDLGWNEQVQITQHLPLPAQVLAAVSYVNLGDS